MNATTFLLFQYIEMSNKQLNIRLFEQAVARSNEYDIKDKVLRLIPTHTLQPSPTSGTIEVRNQDCIETLIELSESIDSSEIAMLCMASDYHPGGGVKKGCTAQEEHLCRHSTLYQTLMKVKQQNLYPIIDPFLLPQVAFFSHIDQQKDRAKNLKEDIVCGIIMSAAVRKRDTGFSEDDIKESRRRIEAMLKLCAQHGYRVLILSAYGCGAYRNPPKVIAGLFKALLDDGYGQYFDRIVFSVIGENFAVFNELLHR